jgi:O-antigen/teichoic acid export membrane protein
MIKAGILLSIFNGIAAVLGLLRNIAVARLLSIEDFGIASTFAMAMSLIEMSANIGISRFIVQAKDGESPEFQANLQAFQVVRGFAGGAIMLLIADPLASAFDVPEAAWAYRLMAILPVIRGFAHLDMSRFQRSRNFGPSIYSETAAQAVSTVSAVILAFVLKDYRAILYSLLLQQAAFVLLTCWFAERKFKIAWSTAQVKRAVGFGWPLLLNSALMFCIFQGDRFIVGSNYGVGDLGWFSVAMMLTLMPLGLVIKVIHTLCLPELARHQSNPPVFALRAGATIEAACLVGVAMAVGYALIGGPLVLTLYGAKYGEALTVLIVLAVMQAVRLAKAGPSIVAISQAETTNPLYANLARILFLPIAYVAASKGASIVLLAWVALAGELASLILSYVLLAKRVGISARHLSKTFLTTIAVLSLPLIYEWAYPAQASAYAQWAGAGLLIATGIYVLQLSYFTSQIKVLVQNWRRSPKASPSEPDSGTSI